MTPRLAERADTAADLLGSLRAGLSESERNRFDLELLDVARHGERDELRRLLESWLITVTVRDHPAYEDQYKDFVTAMESGDLFAGTPLAGAPFPEAL